MWFDGGRSLLALHLHGALGDPQQGADPGGRELHGRRPGLPGHERPELPDLVHRRARRQRRRLRRLRRRQARQRLARCLGVLSHYDAVIWYTGDDYLTRQPGQPARNRHGAARRRGDDRRPPLPQRGRQAVLHRQERRPAVRGGQRVPQLRVPGAAGRAASTATTPRRSSTRTTWRTPTAASPTTTTSSSTTWGPTSTPRPATRSTSRTTTRSRCAARGRSRA